MTLFSAVDGHTHVYNLARSCCAGNMRGGGGGGGGGAQRSHINYNATGMPTNDQQEQQQQQQHNNQNWRQGAPRVGCHKQVVSAVCLC